MLIIDSPEEVRRKLQQQFPAFAPASETLPLAELAGRVLAEEIRATNDVPGFDRATMDGYALAARDSFGASPALPAMLRLVSEIKMGEAAAFALQPGQCAAIPTGGALPPGADCVAMVEHSERLADGTVFLETALAPGQHIAFRGDDVPAGARILPPGQRLGAAEIGVLAALGRERAAVYQKPKVGILSTGDELVPLGQPLSGAAVYDVNSHLLAACVQQAGAEAHCYGIIKDDWPALQQALRLALAENELVLISGGSSVGALDLTARLIDEAGEPGVFVHGVAVKPGRPTIIGNAAGKPVFGLPGHPVSAYFIYRLFALPLLQRLCGSQTEAAPRLLPARLGSNVSSHHGREDYLLVRLEQGEEGYRALPVAYKSGLISALAQSEGYFRIDRNCEGLPQGSPIMVQLF